MRAQLKPVLDAQCGWLFKCCSTGELAQQLGPATSDNCSDHLFESATVGFAYGLTDSTDTQNLLNVLNYVQYGFDDSTVKIDTTAIAACAAQLSAKDCTPAPPPDHCTPTAPVTSDACALDKLLVGSLPAGSDCTAYGANECAPGLLCKGVANQAGVCIAEPKVDDLCLHDLDCGSLVCDWTSGKCTAGAAYGAACAFSDPDHPVPGTEATRCAQGLVCDTVTLKCADPNCASGINCSADTQCPTGVGCVMNVCGPLRQAGESCFQTKDCAEGTCNYDPLANRSLCTAPKAAGATCQQATDCASGFCQFDSTALVSVCTATQKDGAACLSSQGEECDSGKCVAQVCAAVKAGDACTGDVDCAPSHSLYCAGTTCALAPFATGKPCSADTQCVSGACIGLTCLALGSAGDACGAATDAPCDASSYCALAVGKDTGKCAAKKAQGELCASDIECVSNCAAANGELRCTGEPLGVANCGGNDVSSGSGGSSD